MARGGYRGNSYSARRGRQYPFYAASRPTSSPAASYQKAEPCAIFTRTGRCDQIKSCRYRHDPDRVALCQQFLMTGRCSKPGGERCFLSHSPRPENKPMCKHFARGRCDNSNCQFAHMTNLEKDPDSTPVCRTFALNGWCDREVKCPKRHSFDCPDFETHGSCANPKCTLQHVIKAPKEKMETQPVKDSKETVSLAEFVTFLKTVDRSKFDLRLQNDDLAKASRAEEVGSDVSDNNAESDAEDDSASESELEELPGAAVEETDMNADFIRV